MLSMNGDSPIIGGDYIITTEDGELLGKLLSIALTDDDSGLHYRLRFPDGKTMLLHDSHIEWLRRIPSPPPEQMARARELVAHIAEYCDPYAVGVSGEQMRELLDILDIPLRTEINDWSE